MKMYGTTVKIVT